MTVMIHPKDQGPIDTANRERCDSCDNTIMVKGNRVYKTETRPSDRGKRYSKTYLETCPYCKGGVNSPITDILYCKECKTYFPTYKVNRSGNCPSCKVELTQENTKEV